MKFLVDVKDISYATIAVEAKDAAEAEAIAKELYFNGKINWSEADVTWEARPDERNLRRLPMSLPVPTSNLRLSSGPTSIWTGITIGTPLRRTIPICPTMKNTSSCAISTESIWAMSAESGYSSRSTHHRHCRYRPVGWDGTPVTGKSPAAASRIVWNPSWTV